MAKQKHLGDLSGDKRTTLKIVSDTLNILMNWSIAILLVVMAGWLYALTTTALLKYIGS